MTSLILAALSLTGYTIYLRMAWSARWAGDTAAYMANELAIHLDKANANSLDPSVLPPNLLIDYMESMVPPVDVNPLFRPGDPEYDPILDGPEASEWLLVFQPDGTIAATLVIREKTVKTHITNILSKLHLNDRTQAAIYALKQGIVPIDEA